MHIRVTALAEFYCKVWQGFSSPLRLTILLITMGYCAKPLAAVSVSESW